MADRIGSEPLTPEEEPFLRDAVTAVLHRHQCEELPAGHSWREHLPWDAEEDALQAETMIDDLISTIRPRFATLDAAREPVAGLREAYNDLANIEDPYSDPKQIAAFEDAIMRSRAVLRLALADPAPDGSSNSIDDPGGEPDATTEAPDDQA